MPNLRNHREKQIKLTMREHLTLVRMVIIKKKKKKRIRSARMEGRRELLCTVGRNVNWFCPRGKQYGSSSKKLKLEL